MFSPNFRFLFAQLSDIYQLKCRNTKIRITYDFYLELTHVHIYILQVHKLHKNSLDVHIQASSLTCLPGKRIKASGSRFLHSLNENRDKKSICKGYLHYKSDCLVYNSHILQMPITMQYLISMYILGEKIFL